MFYSLKKIDKTSWQRVLDDLVDPYNKTLPNYNEFVTGLQEKLTEEDCEYWFEFPDYSYNTRPMSLEEIQAGIPHNRRQRLAELTPKLTETGMVAVREEKGHKAYYRNYMFGIYLFYRFNPDGSTLAKACHHWWMDAVNGGQTGRMAVTTTRYRTIPVEAAVTGKPEHGKIPMGIEIPDARKVVPMDRVTESLAGVKKFAVQPCICRMEQEDDGIRQCDFPIEEVCITFDEAAEDVDATGIGHFISREEAMEIIRKCGDMGLVHTISDAEHPLALCNCCSCCCLCLRSIERGETNIARGSNFAAAVSHAERCIGCGHCAEVCPMGSLSVTAEGIEVKKNCIGCGICAAQCPKGVLSLEKRPGASTRPTSLKFQRIYM